MKGALQTALTVATTLRTLPFDVNLWQAQNIWNDLFRRSDKEYWSPEWKLLLAMASSMVRMGTNSR